MVGKDAFADAICEGFGWRKTYMSSKLEQALLLLDPIVEVRVTRDSGMKPIHYSQLHAEVGYDESKQNTEVRRLLIRLGTEVGRELIDRDLWTKLVFAEVDEWLDARESVVVTGIRFHNELEAIRQRNGTAIWIDRPGVRAVMDHDSENTLKPSDFDSRLLNDGSLEQLREHAAEVVAYLGATTAH